MLVTKRDGTTAPLDLSKFHRVVLNSCEGITGVSASDIEIKSQIQFKNKMKTSEIQEILIKAAAELITQDTPNYQYVAGRLINYHLRKEVYGQYTPIHLYDHVKNVIDKKYYDKQILELYTKEEFDELNAMIDHTRDDLLTFAAMEQFRGKYLVKNRVSGEIYETPQMCYILVSATLFANYPKETRMKYVKKYYDAISKFDISLPTPIMAGVRTPSRQYASCVLIDCDDSLDSINASTSAIVKYISQKAGIGLNVGRLRAEGSPIRGGEAKHTGLIPFIKMFQAAVKSCSQGGIRGGAATFYYPIWHLEVENLLVLKNNKGTEESRARHVDYGVQFNKLMYERLLTGGDITLFSPHDVPGLYEAFFNDQDHFKTLYERAERNPKIKKDKIKAIDLFSAFVQERQDTGRIYLMNVDHCNTHSSFIPEKATVYMSNLCTEITLPTNPLNDLNDAAGEISTCILSAINWGNIRKPSDFESVCNLAVRGLDALISYQNYPVLAAEIATKARRNLGVGIINFAYWLAKHDLNYQDIDATGLALIDEYVEAWSYYLIKASVDLAEEFGPCDKYKDTKYSKGILPIDTYKKEVDELVAPSNKMDWEELRDRLVNVGIRNSTLMALMPSESSSQISNATNGIEPPRSLVSIKQSKDGVLKQVVPEIKRLKNKYDLLWDQKSPEGYLKIVAILQRYIDQTISANTSYNPKFYPEHKVPMSEHLKMMVNAYKWGIKTFYYNNTNDMAGEIEDDESLPELLQSDVDDSEDCEACAI
ncbi:MAG: ribonucleoside-diphosphate reductase subunit alpha [Gammaproteobacteria bacterium]|nr:ribonucleoside-diphosphate reductase subunit alpha [Gammaproteobacteria bacterium]